MRGSREAPHAFLFFGVFTGFEDLLEEVRGRVEARYGPLHLHGVSPVYEFPRTRSYARTMGPNLKRQFFVLAERWPQDGLAPVKHAALEIESECARLRTYGVDRPVNIDPGLLNDCRIILASTKDYSHRIYRSSGIWEEVTLIFEKGAWRPLPWTYPDFRAGTYHAFFQGLRAELLDLIQSERQRSQ